MDAFAGDTGWGSPEQVEDRVPKRIKAVQFSIASPQDILSQSILSLQNRELYDLGIITARKREPARQGLLDPRLGTSSRTDICHTCDLDLYKCNGHFGHIKLTLPTFHYGYMRKIIDVLSCVCKECSRILLGEKERRAWLIALRRKDLDSLRRSAICKGVTKACRKTKVCPSCGSCNGPVKKVPGNPIKIVHNKFAAFISSKAQNKRKPEEMVAFEGSFMEAKRAHHEVDRLLKRAADDLTPLRVLSIFKKISDRDVELLGMHPGSGRPEHMIWTYLPAPPVAIRPSVAQESASTEDDITNKLADIVDANNLLRASLRSGAAVHVLMDKWEHLQYLTALLIDGSVNVLGLEAKSIRGFSQRLKGKQGRFRGNLSGKRVDFSGRTVISPDPNLGIDEVAVPVRVAMQLTYPEKVTRYNIERLKQCVARGANRHPGANFIDKGNEKRRLILKIATKKGDLRSMVNNLQIGDTVERHLTDGDIVLFNRQPSLHKLSILCHQVKVRPWRTFRLNECVCTPYNADFDGDEMNLHVPQTEEARAEALELMGVKNNLATPKNGTPIIAAIQDFITGAYLITQKDRFFSRQEFAQIVSHMFGGMAVKDPITGAQQRIELPAPALVKPQIFWTGKQLWSVLMKPHRSYPVNVNLDAKGKQFTGPTRKGEAPDLSENDSYLVIRNSEVMCGTMDKAVMGDGKKDSVFYVIMRDFGPSYAVASMNRLAKLSARWLTEQGFSIGIGDVYPSQALKDKKEKLVKQAYEKCLHLIQAFNEGKLERDPGCDEEQTMENQISGILSKVRQQCGDVCFAELSRYNAPLTMAKCGSKGSNINVSQMVAAVGQQIIGGKRVIDGFQDRTLPHFTKASRDPPAKGFVVNSFFSGLNPTEFIFHAMSGREGLVDTAVKTAETGYMSRRLMKSLEDLSSRYDHTVRNSSEGVVQMKFGDDGLDPVDMEGSAKPVNFERTFMHATSTTWDNSEKGLTSKEVARIVSEVCNQEKSKLERMADDGTYLAFHDKSDAGVDQQESVRDFLQTMSTFVSAKVTKIISSQQRHGDNGGIFKLSLSAMNLFLKLCLRKFEKAKVEAGHAVGAVGAQSIGEPGTQMTLKTFHFAGVAGMSITQGVPRIKEIINATAKISTPVITCALDSKYEEIAGRFAKALIQKTYLRDIVNYIEDVWSPNDCYLNMRVDWKQIQDLGLRINLHTITQAIETHKGFKTLGVQAIIGGRCHIRVFVNVPDIDDLHARRRRSARPQKIGGGDDDALIGKDHYGHFMTVQKLKRRLPDVVIQGYPEAHRAILKKDDKPDSTGHEPLSVFVEGHGLRRCMTTDGIDGCRTKTNSVIETQQVLGIEAARSTIIAEILAVMGGMDIDPRHTQLLADVMTYRGDVLGITRFGLAKMRDSVLQLASFEKTVDHLYEAATAQKKDEIRGVSECIIMGQSVGIGTGAMTVMRPLKLEWEKVREGREVETFGSVVKGLVKERREVLRERRSDLIKSQAGEGP